MFKKVLLSTALSLLCITSIYAEDIDNNNSKLNDNSYIEKYVKYKYNKSIKDITPKQIGKVKNEISIRESLYKKAKSMDLIKENDPKFIFLKEITNKDLYINMFLDKYSKNIKPTDTEIETIYVKNKHSFKKEAEYKARHILVSTKKEAEKIINNLNKSKNITQDFIKNAKEYSIGPSGKNGGELGWFKSNAMVPQFSKALVNMKKGTISKEPVKTKFGYHIILLEDYKKPSISSLKEVKQSIIKMIKNQKMKELIKSVSGIE